MKALSLSARDIARFWSHVEKTATCWLWQGSPASRYGRFNVGGTHYGAHRVSYELAYGSIPPGLLVCHNCPDGDNPHCVRPDHLWLGTDAVNQADKATKGRGPRGTRGGNTRLTDAQVLLIRQRYATGAVTQHQLAAEFGVSRSCISHIVVDGSWAHLAPTPRPKQRMVHRGIMAGENNPRAKLTAAQAQEIRARYAAGGIDQYALARLYGVSQGVITHVVTGRSWRQVVD